MEVTQLTTSWLGYNQTTGRIEFWDGQRYRPLEEASNYAPLDHTHAMADISGLSAALNARLPLTGGTLSGGLELPFADIGGTRLTGDADDLFVWTFKVMTDQNMPAGIMRGQQTFIASSAWTKPIGIRRVLAWLWGAGGGGGGAQGGAAGGACGAGGGAGGFGWKWIDVSALTSVAVTIGAPGASGSTAGGNGGTGGTSSFGAHLSATGGVGGSGQTTGNWGQIVAGGSGGVASSGDFNVIGSPGSPGIRLDHENGIAGRGAASAMLGGGGNGFAGNTVGQAGFARGDGGGGGVVAANATGRAGGAGASGMVWLWMFE